MIAWKKLTAAALQARAHAYAPYSHFRVGAALLTRAGTVFTGANVENRSFGLTVCAERVAVFAAVHAGMGLDDLVALAIATNHTPPASPCGACRQVLSEFAADFPILLINPRGERVRTNLAKLLPLPFHDKSLKRAHGRTR
jgi:cytidine deaminase